MERADIDCQTIWAQRDARLSTKSSRRSSGVHYAGLLPSLR
eukprot:SAG11_NODE_6529_length_1294_cov_1.587448_3_plen_40_part_01